MPLTQSLYVPGMISESNKVLVDIGTGYYVEKSVPKAKELLDRKVCVPDAKAIPCMRGSASLPPPPLCMCPSFCARPSHPLV